MDLKIKGIAEYLVREALYGWYNKRDMNHGSHDMAIGQAYRKLLYCARQSLADPPTDNDVSYDMVIVREITKAILMAYWGKKMTGTEIVGERYRRSAHQVYLAFKDCVRKTMDPANQVDWRI